MSSLPAPTFASLLRRARRAAGLTQEELAERAGISVDAISTLERGLSRAPHQDTLERLSEALQLSAEAWARWELAVQGKRLPGATAEEPDAAGTVLPLPPGDPDQVSGEVEQALVPPDWRTSRLRPVARSQQPRPRSSGGSRRCGRSVRCSRVLRCACSP